MSRVNVYESATDEWGQSTSRLAGWFDWSKARCRCTDADADGDGSGGTGRGQAVLLTAQGKWVLESWTRWQGETNRYEYISADEARDWLLRNNEDAAVAEHFGEIPEEDDRRGGRPEIGGAAHIRFGRLLPLVDKHAGERSTDRPRMIRRYVAEGLAREGVITESEATMLMTGN